MPKDRFTVMQKDNFIYTIAAHELCLLVDKTKLKLVTSEGGSVIAQVSKIKELLYDAIMKSSLSSFSGTPYVFTGRVYEPMTYDEFRSCIHDLWKELGLSMVHFEMRGEKVIKDCLSKINTKQLRPDNSKVVFENGVFDLERKYFSKQVDKNTVQFSVMPYNFDNHALCTNWQMFLDTVLPEASYQEVLQEFLGSIFIDRHLTKIETMLILFGDGANGKSVIFQTIVGLLGAENVSNYGVSALINGQEKKKNIASINGKRLNYCSELGAKGYIKDTDTLKALISGEPMEARALYGNNFTAYDIPLFMSNTNKLPKFMDYSHGMKRRITVLPFKVQIPPEKRNPNLATELTSEYAGIFNWIVEGRDKFRMNGFRFTETEYINGKYEDKPMSEGNVMRYMLAKNKAKPYAFMPVKAKNTDVKAYWVTMRWLYPNYCLWCKGHSQSPTVAKTIFRDLLRSAGYEYERRSGGMSFKVFKITK